MRVLLVEDNEMLGKATRDALAEVFAVDWKKSVQNARESLAGNAYDLAILDISLPDGSGMDLLKMIREQKLKTPVLFLTARDAIRNRIEGLNAGADDYVVKPFDIDELIARCMALIRRSTGILESSIVWKKVVYDPQARTLRVSGKSVPLSRRELSVVDYLMRNIGKVLSKSQIEEAIYNGEEEVDSNTVEVHISSLRRKVSKDFIKTIRGVGYTISLSS